MADTSQSGVGIDVGGTEGTTVGGTEGITVGIEVGDKEGITVGGTEGFTVGIEVGGTEDFAQELSIKKMTVVVIMVSCNNVVVCAEGQWSPDNRVNQKMTR